MTAGQAVVAGDFVYLAGVCPVLPDGTWVRGSFAEQARAAFTNLVRVAAAAGADLSQAVRVGVRLRDFAHFPELNEIYAEFRPARRSRWPWKASTSRATPSSTRDSRKG